MKNNDSRKKENGIEEKWYACMDTMEAVWKARIAEARLEYLKEFIKAASKRSESESIL